MKLLAELETELLEPHATTAGNQARQRRGSFCSYPCPSL